MGPDIWVNWIKSSFQLEFLNSPRETKSWLVCKQHANTIIHNNFSLQTT